MRHRIRSPTAGEGAAGAKQRRLLITASRCCAVHAAGFITPCLATCKSRSDQHQQQEHLPRHPSALKPQPPSPQPHFPHTTAVPDLFPPPGLALRASKMRSPCSSGRHSSSCTSTARSQRMRAAGFRRHLPAGQQARALPAWQQLPRGCPRCCQPRLPVVWPHPRQAQPPAAQRSAALQVPNQLARRPGEQMAVPHWACLLPLLQELILLLFPEVLWLGPCLGA